MNLTYTQAIQDKYLEQILKLQIANLETSIDVKELKEQGFVTATHDLSLLKSMCASFGHSVCIDNDKVVAYSLVMLKSFRDAIPVLTSMYDQIDEVLNHHEAYRGSDYVVMGQVCVDRLYRGTGVFKGVYHQMKRSLSKKFPLVITQISERNQRSLRAHSKIGFKTLKQYISPEGEHWHLVYWDWSTPKVIEQSI